jgi:hypothetical protein
MEEGERERAMEPDQTGRKGGMEGWSEPAKEGHRVLFYTASITDDQRASGRWWAGWMDAATVRLVACLLLLARFLFEALLLSVCGV